MSMRRVTRIPVCSFNLVCRTLLRLCLGLAPLASWAQGSPEQVLRETILEVSVNSQSPGEMLVVLREGADRLWLDAADFTRLRLRAPAVAAHLHQQRHYLPLAALPNLSLSIDEQRQSAAITLPADAFLRTRISVNGRAPPMITAASAGAFVNYQISAQRVAGRNTGGVFAELGVFGPAGVLTNSGLVRTLDANRTATRLDSSFTHDFPRRIERLIIGDSISDGGNWGSAVHFGGLSWGRNFSLRPDLLTTPLLAASGSAVVPSTVDIFVNNQKVSSQTLPPGPFVIDQLPAVTGAGNVSIVVRDALGREQLLTQPFYSSVQLLAAGLSQYQINAGKIRNDYTLYSNHYGALLAEATYRRGLSNVVTVEGHGEILAQGAHSAGLSLGAAVGHLAIVNTTLAAGGDSRATGSLLAAGVERRGTLLTFTASRTYATAGYRQISSDLAPALQFRTRDLAQLGLSLQRAGSVNLAFARQENYSADPQVTVSLSYSRNLGQVGSLNLAATRTAQGAVTASSVFLTFTMALTRSRALLFSANGGSGPGSPASELYATYVQNPPLGPGAGYRLGASSQGNYDADWRQQVPAGDLELQAARNQGIAGVSLFWNGAVTLLDRQLRPARVVRDSFALVDVGGLPNVPVYLDNQLITHTDPSGRALLHDLLPYQPNRISVDPTELPLDTAIGARTMVLAPQYRSGVIARFPVERVAGGLFRLVTPDRKPVPAGAQVHFKGADFPVTYDGITYVTGFDHGLAGEAHWENSRCDFRLEPPPAGDPLPDMGTITCEPVPAPEVTP